MSHKTLMEYLAGLETKREIIRERYVTAIEDELHAMIVHEALSCVRRAHERISRLSHVDVIVSSYGPEMLREELKSNVILAEINVAVYVSRQHWSSAITHERISAAVDRANETIQAMRGDIPLLQFKAEAGSDKSDFTIVWA